MAPLKFTKMTGLGNNFVIIDDREDQLESRFNLRHLAQQICDIHFGVGADGLVLVLPSENCDLKMRIINSDGSEAEMCGNAVRCFARYTHENSILTQQALNIETLAGTITTHLESKGMVNVEMGSALFFSSDVNGTPDSQSGRIDLQLRDRNFTFISMGNPHAVTFVDDYNFDWKSEGATIEQDRVHFPARVNVEFARIVGESEMEMKVWERGCGATMACGTGACASVVAAVSRNRMKRNTPITVHLEGGDLTIEVKDDHAVQMTGPTETICTGVYYVKR